MNYDKKKMLNRIIAIFIFAVMIITMGPNSALQTFAAAMDSDVDEAMPYDLKVAYEPTFVDTQLGDATVGFYMAPVTVTIEASDETSGIKQFVYSYTVENDASEINTGKTDVVIESADIIYDGERASASFEIPGQFRGKVSFVAINGDGNWTEFTDNRVIVVDTVPPVISLSYDNENVKNGKYYDADRTATIAITEANFFKEDIEDGLLVITVGKTTYDNVFTETIVKPEFTKDGDVYTATVAFTENADYTLDIQYTDRSGNVQSSEVKDEFTIDKTQPGISIGYDIESGLNGKYYNTGRTATITVLDRNFQARNMSVNITATDASGKKNINLNAKGYQAYLQKQSNWTHSGDEWSTQIDLDVEGNYTIDMEYVNMTGKSKEIHEAFCIDKGAPEGLKITYEPTLKGTIFEALTFGFYRAPLKVTVEATDEYSGIDFFSYSYTVQEGASKTNTGKSDVMIENKSIVYDGNKATAFFEIPAQFRGSVSFTATDKAGNTNSFEDINVVVVDDVPPVVDVVYSNSNAKHTNYFAADTTTTIIIEEANFFETDINEGLLEITVGQTLGDGTYIETQIQPTFTKNEDVYTTDVSFTEQADYIIDIRYTDRSGNIYSPNRSHKFTIDKTAPVIEVFYDNNACNYGTLFKEDREATIVITEHNFHASDVVATITANNTIVKKYTDYLQNDANWIHDGDVHTAKILFTDDANYIFSISCTDMAGNQNNGVNYGSSVAPTQFSLDKSVPTDLMIKIDEVSVLGTGSIVFDTFYAGEVVVKLSANFGISGMESLKYQKIAAISEYREDGIWIDYNEDKGVVISTSEKFIIVFRAEDRAGNVSIINSTGIVVETMAPEIDILLASTNINGYYNGNVEVGLNVVDPENIGSAPNTNGYYSGLKKIDYRIYASDISAVEEGTLFDFSSVTASSKFDEDRLVQSWSGGFIIHADKFNSNNVIVDITAIDNAGNTRTSSTNIGDIMIDVTAPTIDIIYSNNNADSGSYFKEERVANIVVTDRNFNPDDIRLTLTNSAGVIPQLGAWTKSEGTGNQDDTKWTAFIVYSDDGDYEFDIDCTDMAGNACISTQYGDSIMPNKFTIDQTVPEVSVSYDNNEAINTNYYKEARVATIVITEHNLEPNGADKDRITITMTATDDGTAATVPAVSTWKTVGDTHTATIQYSDDGLYTFDIVVMDKAGNESTDFAEQLFYIDKTAPTIEITGVENNSANRGNVIPVITYADTNYDDEQVFITLTGANRKNVELDGVYTDIHNGCIFTFRDFAEEKQIDDIYTLTVALTDMAGNSSTETVTFSVNRFGSTYALSETTETLNGAYVREADDVVVTETNADELNNITITLFKNNTTITLDERTDYRIDAEGGNGEWYKYTYTVFAKNFEDDGVYRLVIHSEDLAGNIAENMLDTKDAEIRFGVDKTKPNIVIANLEDGKTYAMENLTVKVSASDNLFLNTVTVYLDNYNDPYKVWTSEEIESMQVENGELSFEVRGDSTSAHKIKIVCTDAAQNEQIEEITGFYVTTNLFVRYYNNKFLFFGSIWGAIFFVCLIVLIMVYRKRKVSSLV